MRKKVEDQTAVSSEIKAVYHKIKEFYISRGDLTEDEKRIIEAGCVINYYKYKNKPNLKEDNHD